MIYKSPHAVQQGGRSHKGQILKEINMLVRGIFVCMGVTVLSIASIPVIEIFKGVSAERAQMMASSGLQIDSDATDTEIAATLAESLNDIETAAGTDMQDDMPYDETDAFSSGFSGTAPAALAEPVDTPEAF